MDEARYVIARSQAATAVIHLDDTGRVERGDLDASAPRRTIMKVLKMRKYGALALALAGATGFIGARPLPPAKAGRVSSKSEPVLSRKPGIARVGRGGGGRFLRVRHEHASGG